MEWQPIETAPKDGTRILLCRADGVYGVAALVDDTYDGISITNDKYAWIGVDLHWGNRMSVWMGGDDPREATHWMPLPPPPDISPTR